MKHGLLSVGNGHKIYWEEYGNPEGIPILVCHGGPGGSLNRATLKLLDKYKWRIIMFDQRGCGASTPRDSTVANTTWHLVADMECIRIDRDVDRWALWGGSWGTTLALAYASRHHDRVVGMVLRGVCLMEPWEQEWLYGPNGAARLNPDGFTAFCKPIGPPCTDYRKTLRSYRSLMRSRKTRRAATKAWWAWEADNSFLRPQSVQDKPADIQTLSILENHYFLNNAWLRPGQLRKAATKMNFPIYIVQGRYDLVCPPAAATSLARAAPRAFLTLVHSGHSQSEPATMAGLKVAAGRLAKELST
jgi:proline iminopeptidase